LTNDSLAFEDKILNLPLLPTDEQLLYHRPRAIGVSDSGRSLSVSAPGSLISRIPWPDLERLRSPLPYAPCAIMG